MWEGDRDEDKEPSLGSPEIGHRLTLWATDSGVIAFQASQERWASGAGEMEEEAVNEDGDEAEYSA